MSKLSTTLDTINELLVSRGCGLYEPDLNEIGEIIAVMLITHNTHILKEDAIQWLNNRGNHKDN